MTQRQTPQSSGLQMANWGFHEQRVKLLIQGAEAHGLVNITTLASPHRLDTNSLDEPDKACQRSTD